MVDKKSEDGGIEDKDNGSFKNDNSFVLDASLKSESVKVRDGIAVAIKSMIRR